MAEGVAQWLAEIQALKQEVAMLRQARDQAYASIDKWRQLYDAEAQQRRRDAANYQRSIDELRQALTTYRSPSTAAKSEQLTAELAGIQSNQSVERLQTQLIAAKQECAQLRAMLQAEQTDHAQTRESLTAALGDAVDLLARERVTPAGSEPPLGS